MALSKDINKLRYWSHKNGCYRRVDANGNPIEFRLTFQQWLDIWESSGFYHLYGRGKGKYCMSRINDVGHYEVGNVQIVTFANNMSQAKSKPIHTPLGIFDKINDAAVAHNTHRNVIRHRTKKYPEEYYFL